MADQREKMLEAALRRAEQAAATPSPDGEAAPNGEAAAPNGGAAVSNGEAAASNGEAAASNGEAAASNGEAAVPNGEVVPLTQMTVPQGVVPFTSASTTSVNMVCVRAEDLFALVQRFTSSKSSFPVFSSFGNTAATAAEATLEKTSASEDPLPTVVEAASQQAPETLPSYWEVDSATDEAAGIVPPSPDVLIMGNGGESPSSCPSPNYDWMFESSPKPVFSRQRAASKSPDSKPSTSRGRRSQSPDFKFARTARAPASASTSKASPGADDMDFWRPSAWKNPTRTSARTPSPDFTSNALSRSSRRQRSPSPDFKFARTGSASASASKASPGGVDLDFCRPSAWKKPTRTSARTPSPDFTSNALSRSSRRQRSPSPDFKFARTGRASASASASKASPGGDDMGFCTPSAWKKPTRTSARTPSPDFTSNALSRSSRRQRSPSPDFKFARTGRASASASASKASPGADDLDFCRPSAWKKPVRTSARTPSPDFSSTALSRSSRRQRSPSPDFKFARTARTPASASTSKASPGGDDMDFCRPSAWKKPSRTSVRTPSPDFSSFLGQNSLSSRGRRSQSPEVKFSRKSRCAAASRSSDEDEPDVASNKRTRSQSPEVKFSRKSRCAAASRSSDEDEPDVASNKRKSSNDPDFEPSPKKLSTAKKPQKASNNAPPKRRGRPRKTKTSPPQPKICPVCKEEASGCLKNTECGHVFHDQCLANWLNTQGQKLRPEDCKVCPTCGMDFNPKNNNIVYL